ncbi:putative SP-containing protein [Vairimorpha necatrix]|uniref:SP-containing protein n=1 Tax=Vairimorpha necatrix TaxID=6039 RepID=A0AAX4JF27_9MICR
MSRKIIVVVGLLTLSSAAIILLLSCSQKIGVAVITDQYIGKLNIDDAVKELAARFPGHTQEQYKLTLIALRIYSDVRTSWLRDDEANTNFCMDKNVVDNFLSSLGKDIFLKENGIKECFSSSRDVRFECINRLFYLLFQNDDIHKLVGSMWKYHKEPFASLKRFVEKKWDEDFILRLHEYKIKHVCKGKERDVGVDDYVWGVLFAFLSLLNVKNTAKFFNFES